MSWEERYVTVCAEGGHRTFFDRFLLAIDVRSLVLVSPWISAEGDNRDIFERTVSRISREKVHTLVVLRHPSKEPTNWPAVRQLQELPTVDLHFNNELHAKVYVCKCAPYGFAYVGSANLTGRGTTAYEVGLMVDGRGNGVRILDELERLGTTDLLNRAGTFDHVATSERRKERV